MSQPPPVTSDLALVSGLRGGYVALKWYNVVATDEPAQSRIRASPGLHEGAPDPAPAERPPRAAAPVTGLAAVAAERVNTGLD